MSDHPTRTGLSKYSHPAQWHEVANLFPLLSADELKDLSTDIRTHGLQNEVVLLDGKVLDGRNRLLACRLAGVKPRFREFKRNGVSPLSWVISQNLHRRQLTASQKAIVALEAEPMFAIEAKQHQRLGKQKIADPTLKGQARDKAAHLVGVNRQYVSDAKRFRHEHQNSFQKSKLGRSLLQKPKSGWDSNKQPSHSTHRNLTNGSRPRGYVEAARSVLREIELDPASCAIANSVVKAKRYFTITDDGLSKSWKCRSLWLNPPFGDLGPRFVAKLITEYEQASVKEAILLVNSHCTDMKWFQPLFKYVLCFTDHRSHFWHPSVERSNSPHGSVFVHFGKPSARFAKHFRKFGNVVRAYE